ncbi:hypothetical protein P171DRAFT_431444, partial [Karstenula rhodostoma CBS 690.94]
MSIVRYIASFYPPLSERTPYPPLYQLLTFTLSLIPFFFHARRFVAILILPLLLTLCLRAPFYTFGDPSSNYYNTSIFVATPIWLVEFAILRPEEGGEAPVWVGRHIETEGEGVKGKGVHDMTTTWEKLSWVISLMIPSHRGMGWNWQVSRLPDHPDANLPKWQFVGRVLRKAIMAYVYSAIMLVVYGFAFALEKEILPEHTVRRFVANAIIGWSGAFWILNRMLCFYDFCAAASVALGVYDQWQWPPLVGRLQDAWSVSQMWSVVYHQTMRVMVSQPARRITRALGIPKGSMASRIMQLHISFVISCLVHEFEMFNVTRKDMGEFVFFMSQPVAITLEIWVQLAWKKATKAKGVPKSVGVWTGYVWVVVWMSISLPWYVKGMKNAGIMNDAIFGRRPLDAGASLMQG